eukprot:TRINITY_DN3951_c0_g1_i1.p2 TRINITY_DN3951_c0_g1~~TRINITY_DN3951_c0_g1_i1.p2  ORF type:complete len:109 (+),score=33.67 TRINITY_DN3951_c0_g1_i1:505-831(+)
MGHPNPTQFQQQPVVTTIRREFYYDHQMGHPNPTQFQQNQHHLVVDNGKSVLPPQNYQNYPSYSINGYESNNNSSNYDGTIQLNQPSISFPQEGFSKGEKKFDDSTLS